MTLGKNRSNPNKNSDTRRPTHTYLLELVFYDPISGLFQARRSRRGIAAGKRLGRVDERGYRRLMLDQCQIYEHRLAWFYMTGEWPESEIDHIDHNKSNNKWANLRLATTSQNHANGRAFLQNPNRLKGTTYKQAERKWIAQIKVNGKQITIGRFQSMEEAHAAYRIAAKKYFGKFARFE